MSLIEKEIETTYQVFNYTEKETETIFQVFNDSIKETETTYNVVRFTRDKLYTNEYVNLSISFLNKLIPVNVFSINSIKIYKNKYDLVNWMLPTGIDFGKMDPVQIIESDEIVRTNVGIYEYVVNPIIDPGLYYELITYTPKEGFPETTYISSFIIYESITAYDQYFYEETIKVYGYVRRINGTSILNYPIEIRMVESPEQTKYKNSNTLSSNMVKIFTDENGYWEINLIPSVNNYQRKYIFLFDDDFFEKIYVGYDPEYPEKQEIDFSRLLEIQDMLSFSYFEYEVGTTYNTYNWVEKETTTYFNVYNWVELDSITYFDVYNWTEKEVETTFKVAYVYTEKEVETTFSVEEPIYMYDGEEYEDENYTYFNR
jgi:hypothetical protein